MSPIMLSDAENLTQNRRCRCSGNAAYVLFISSAFGEAAPRRPLAREPAAWANVPFKKSISVHDSQEKSHPESSLSFFRHCCIYTVPVFTLITEVMIDNSMGSVGSQCVLNEFLKDHFQSCWMTNKKVLPRIVVVFHRAYFQIVP